MAKKWIGVLLVLGVLFLVWQFAAPPGWPAGPPIEPATGPMTGPTTGPGQEAPSAPGELEAPEKPAVPAWESEREALPAIVNTAAVEESPVPAVEDSPQRDDFNARLMRLGGGVPGANVRLTRSRDAVEQWTTNGEGRFSIPRSSRRGMRRLEIECGDLTLRVSPARLRFRDDPELIYRIGTGTVTVRVWAKGGVPRADAIVALRIDKTGDRASYSQQKTSGSTGTAVFHGVPAGPLGVSGACDSPNSAKGHLGSEGGALTLDLGPAPDAAVLAVQVKLADGSASSTRYRMHALGLGPLAGQRYSVDCTFLPSGLYQTKIPPGRYQITSDPELPGVPLDVEVRAGMEPIQFIAGGAVVRGMLLGRTPSWPDAETGLGSEYGDSPREAWLLDEATGKRLYLARIRDSGRFEIAGVAPGLYILTGNESRIDPELTRVLVQVNDPLDVLEAELEILE